MTRFTDTIEEIAADGQKSGIESDEDLSVTEPFDPDSISIEPKIVTMDTLIRRLRQKTIRLAPTFQRKFVWDDIRRSRLIESLMLRIPLPMFYVAAGEKGDWDVVDGLQRLSTIYEFILGPKLDGNGARLKDLEFLGEKFNGKTYKEILSKSSYARIVNNIMETEMRFTVINPGTPEAVKRNIFKRINTGGMPLAPQEIRHALYQGNSTKLLEKLEGTTIFRKATNNVNDSRMAARELILRFLAFSLINYKSYYPDMDSFLSDTMRTINLMPELDEKKLQIIFNGKLPNLLIKSIDELEYRFEVGMKRAKKLFANHAFRKSLPGYRRTPINKALFEVWGNVLADLSQNAFDMLVENKTELFVLYQKEFNDEKFDRAIGRDGTKSSGVITRFERIEKLIRFTLKEGKNA
jgi:hypothetical protein